MWYNPALTRSTQLSWLKPGYVIQQDQELIDLINNNGYTQAIGHGDVDYFRPYIKFVESGPVDFVMYIVNVEFDFDQVIDRVNDLIKDHVVTGGLIYLAINKYLAHPRCYSKDLPLDYDRAIAQYIGQRVDAEVENYFSCGQDGGNRYNWAHPLTRFHFRVQ